MKNIRNLRAAGSALGLAAILLAGCQRAQQEKPDHPQMIAGVAMQDVEFHSPALKRQMTYRVYLPEGLATRQNLPVVYLLHGGGGGFRDWSNYSDVARYALPEQSGGLIPGGLILVMPEGANSYYLNA